MNTNICLHLISRADAPVAWQMGFQDPATANMQGIVDLHHDIIFFLIVIFSVVSWIGAKILYRFHYTNQSLPERINHHTNLELIWSILPSLIILSIAFPSLTLIYSLDDQVETPGLTVKIVGRQWYWSYEMRDHFKQTFYNADRLLKALDSK
jgi:cytochrome c oxidase subunit 2